MKVVFYTIDDNDVTSELEQLKIDLGEYKISPELEAMLDKVPETADKQKLINAEKHTYRREVFEAAGTQIYRHLMRRFIPIPAMDGVA